MSSLQVVRPFKPRRPHKKSRNGCKYCRRRRIKCDETKPSCLRCVNRRQPCEYFLHVPGYDAQSKNDTDEEPTFAPSIANESLSDLLDPMIITPPASVISAAHTPTLSSERSPNFEISDLVHDPITVPGIEQPLYGVDQTTQAIMKDLYLFDHYIEHTCHDLEILPGVAYVKRFGLPQLAVDNQGILCSVMALGAVCLCIDVLSGQGCGNEVPDLGALIDAGDRYHRRGMESLRQQMSSFQPRSLAEAHAHAILLFPYALARRRLSHLLNDIGPPTPVSGVDTKEEHLSSVAWMIILRGVTTTGRACFANGTSYSVGVETAWEEDASSKPHPMVTSHVLNKLSEPNERDPNWGAFHCRIAPKHPRNLDEVHTVIAMRICNNTYN